jgi:hypothetical protein
MSAAAPPPTKCHCNLEAKHFLILNQVFEDMSKKCSDPQFSNTLKTSGEVFADMARNCSESRSDARAGEVPQASQSQASQASQAPAPQAQTSNLEAKYSKALAEATARAKYPEARAAGQVQTGSVVAPTASIGSSAIDLDDFLTKSKTQGEQNRTATAKSIRDKYFPEAKAAAEARAAAEAKAAPQVPAIQDLTRIRLNDRQIVSYKMITDTLNSTLAQYSKGTDDYKILTQILNEVKAAQTVSEVEKVLTNYKLTTIFQNKSGNYFSIDPKAARAQATQAPAPPVQAPVQAAPTPAFKKPTSDEKFKTSGSTVGFNYDRIIREIDRVLNSKMNSPEMEVMKAKYILLKPRLENAQTYADVQKILTDENVIWDPNKITSGGTRKRRLKKTLRKRSKKTKKAGKRK